MNRQDYDILRGAQEGSGSNRLLDNVDQNIGNKAVVFPQPFNNVNGVVGAQTIPLLDPPRILSLNSKSPTSQMVTVVLGGTLFIPPDVPPPQFVDAGPITAIVEFGNGSTIDRVEIDVPVGPFDFNSTPRQPTSGGVAISVPAGTLRVYARHDGTYVTPRVSQSSAGTTPPGGTVRLCNPVEVLAFVTYFTRPGTLSPRKTLYLGTAGPFVVAGVTLTDDIFSIPPFAKRVRVLRDKATNTQNFDLLFFDSPGAPALDRQTLLAASNSDFVQVPGTANAVGIVSTGQIGPVGNVALEFEIEV
jgi:hypothetical protein